MPMTPGYYMPNLMGQGTYPVYNWQIPQQSYAPIPASQPSEPQEMIWVDGEVAAKSFQMPRGWPMGKPIPLWDLNEPVIYFKSINQAGLPNPIQKARYYMDDEQPQQMLPASQTSGDVAQQPSLYATKEDFEAFKHDMMEAIKAQQPHGQSGGQNNSQNAQQRGNSK